MVKIRNSQLRQFIATGAHYLGRVERGIERERRQKGGATRILRYQRTCDFIRLPYVPYRTSMVHPLTLREHFEYLKNETQVVDLALILKHWNERNELPESCVALTFDGGYLDQIQYAVPLLQEFGFPASFFVPTAFVGSGNLFWHDKVQIVMMALKGAGRKFPKFETLSAEVNFELHSDSGEINAENTLLLLDVLAQLPRDVLMAFLEELSYAAAELDLPPFPRNFASWDELRQLRDLGFSIGSQAHTNRPFSELQREELAAELHISIGELRAEGLNPIPVVASPEDTITPAVAETLQAIGCGICLNVGRNDGSGSPETFLIPERIDIAHENSPTKELFACHVWGTTFLNDYIA